MEIQIFGHITRYRDILERLEKEASIRFKSRTDSESLWIGAVQFFPVSEPSIFEDKYRGKGVLVKELSADSSAFCKANDISFLTSKGELFLRDTNYQISLKPQVKSRASLKIKLESRLTSALPPPTALISPNGFAILDPLFRMTNSELSHFKSAQSFVTAFQLNQSKLSQMMTHLDAKTLTELKSKIRGLPDVWWRSAFHYPMTRKGLTPFFEVAKPYHSLRKEITQSTVNFELIKFQTLDLLPGPVQPLLDMGLIRDSDIYLWGSQSAFHDLKREFQLIPGRKEDATTWHLATPVAGMKRESISSQSRPSIDNILNKKIETNLFRALWDLSFGSSRLNEVQIPALRKILDEDQ